MKMTDEIKFIPAKEGLELVNTQETDNYDWINEFDTQAGDWDALIQTLVKDKKNNQLYAIYWYRGNPESQDNTIQFYKEGEHEGSASIYSDQEALEDLQVKLESVEKKTKTITYYE